MCRVCQLYVFVCVVSVLCVSVVCLCLCHVCQLSVSCVCVSVMCVCLCVHVSVSLVWRVCCVSETGISPGFFSIRLPILNGEIKLLL